MEDFGTAITGLILVIIIGCIYAIPSYVSRGRVRFWQVFWINILLGRTLVGWAVAIVLALDKSNKKLEEKNKPHNKRESFLKKGINIPDRFIGIPVKRIIKIILWIVGILFGIVSIMAIIGGIEAGKLTKEEEIFRELILCQDNVRKELEEQYPTDGNNPIYWSGPIAVSGSFNRKLYEENAYKNAELSKTAYEPCDDMLLEKYQLSTGELKEIRNKGLLEKRIGKLGL